MFSAKELSRIEVAKYFASLLRNWKFYQRHFFKKNYKANIC